jgi:hypothetical protein
MELENAKNILKSRIIADTAEGINGVGIDPDEDKLVVFFTNRVKAEEILREQFGDEFFSSIKMETGEQAFAPESTGSQFLAFFNNILLAIQGKIPLRPASQIRPLDGKRGRAGCFVKHQDGAVAVLTAEHLFFKRTEHLVRAKALGSFHDAGKSWLFGNIQPRPAVNTADCALFLPDEAKVELKKDPRITGRTITAGKINKVRRKKVTTLVPGQEGKVLDVTALIVYEVFLNGQFRKAIFDNQILVDGQGFGLPGHSGALVVMAQPVPEEDIRINDALGLYTFVNANRDKHIVTPLFECMRILRIVSPINP